MDMVGRAVAAGIAVATVLTGLDTVWDLAWSPDGRLFISERPGRIRVWSPKEGGPAVTLEAPLAVAERGEAGLMGLALDPAFPNAPYVYACYTYETAEGTLANRVDRLELDGDRLSAAGTVLDGMRGGFIHNGCRLAFGPDGKLLVTMGDAGDPSAAPDPRRRNGKVLRVRTDGEVPPDNPYADNPVWTLGHRNPQGIAIRPGSGEVYISEHGPDTDDEINRLRPGANYGWPRVRGRVAGGGTQPALWAWTPTIAPAGIAFTDERTLYMATLKEGRLHRLRLDTAGRVVEDTVVLEGYGRLRAVAVGPDGCLYVGTSNRDGRGRPYPEDDRVLRLCVE